MTMCTGCSVRVIDSDHPMAGWIGVITPRAMWSKPMYKPIPEGSHRVEFDSGDGRFYGDYREDQLLLIREPGKR